MFTLVLFSKGPLPPYIHLYPPSLSPSPPSLPFTYTVRLHISLRHSIIIRPLLNRIEIPTHMMALVVRPVAFFRPLAGELVEGEDVDVT